MDGSFNFGPDGAVEVISGPPWTRAAIKQVQQALAEAQYKIAELGEDPTQVVSETVRRLEHANPRFAAKAKRLFESKAFANTVNLLTLLATLAMGISSLSADTKSWDDAVLDRLIELEVDHQLQKQKLEELSRKAELHEEDGPLDKDTECGPLNEN